MYQRLSLGDGLCYFPDVEGVEDAVAGLEVGRPVAAVDLAAAVHHQRRNGDSGAFLPDGQLGAVDAANPAPFHRRRVDHLPLGIVVPLAVVPAQEAEGVAVAARLLYPGVLENMASEAHHGDGDLAQESVEVPLEKGAVGDHALNADLPAALGGVEEHRQSAGRVAAECDVGVAVAANLGQSRIDVLEIFLLVAHVEGVLPGQAAAAVAAQVDGVEVDARIDHQLAHEALEEIIVEAVDVEEGAAAAAGHALADDCGPHGAVEGAGVGHEARLVAFEHIGPPCGIDGESIRRLGKVAPVPVGIESLCRAGNAQRGKYDQQEQQLLHTILTAEAAGLLYK